MERAITLFALMVVAALPAVAQTTGRRASRDKRVEEEIMRLYKYEHDILLRRDIAALERFYPDDFVVTNPFNQFINKRRVLERVRSDVIKYTSFERQFEYFRVYGDTVVVVGSEMVVPAPDANRPDAGADRQPPVHGGVDAARRQLAEGRLPREQRRAAVRRPRTYGFARR